MSAADSTAALTSPSRHRLVIGAMLISSFMAAVEITVISTAMPSIVAELGGFSLFSWAFGIYVLTQAVTTPLYGRLADSHGRKRVYIAAAALFLLGSLLCGCAWSMQSLILFRAIQGIGGGGLIPLATTIIGDNAAPAERPRLMGYVSGIWGIAAIIGPLLGAFCVNTLGWPFVFWVNLPIGVITITMVARYLQEPPRVARPAAVDLPGSAMLVTGLGLVMLVLVQFETLAAGQIIGCILAGGAALAAFARRERGLALPLLPARLWRSPLIVMADFSALMCGALMIGVSGFLPTWVQGVLGGTTLMSGVAIGVTTLCWTAAAMSFGPVGRRLSYRAVALLSAAVLLAGCAGLVLLTRDTGHAWMYVTCGLVGIGLGLNSIVFTISVQSQVPHSDRGRAIALFYFSRMIGQALGAAAFGGVLNAGMSAVGSPEVVRELIDAAGRAAMTPAMVERLTVQLAHAMHGVFILAAAFAVGVLVAAILVPRGARLEAD